MQENMKEYRQKRKPGKRDWKYIQRRSRKSVEQIFGNNPAVSGGETPPENDAQEIADITGGKTVEYGPV